MTLAEQTLHRAEQLADGLLPDRTAKKRMLVIVNPYASTVSDRLSSLVVHALGSRYAVDAMHTEKANHATQICREAAHEGYDVVAALGGDGTVNEAANGLAGSDTALCVLPGGATNVFCRVLGIPSDIVDATEHMLGVADRFGVRRVDLGRVNDRYFTFAAGVGLDASVVERVDRHPRLKTGLGPWYYTYAAVSTFNRRYLIGAPRVRVTVEDKTVEGVTLIAQNCETYTFFGDRPLSLVEGASLDDGALGLTVLRRASPLELPTVGTRALSGKPELVHRARQVEGFPGAGGALVEAVDPKRPFPLQVDGEYIGDYESAEFGVAPKGLAVLG